MIFVVRGVSSPVLNLPEIGDEFKSRMKTIHNIKREPN
jgi:hypothetical protein